MFYHMHKMGGMSLIELLIGIAIAGILAAIAVPSLSTWIANSKIRAGAESIQNGLQIARTEAVRRNAKVKLLLTDNTASWVVRCETAVADTDSDGSPDCPGTAPTATSPNYIQTRSSSSEGTSTLSITSNQTGIAFSSLGRQVSTTNNDSSATASTPVTVRIQVKNPSAGACMGTSAGTLRCLDIYVTASGQIRMCDPALPSSNPQGC